MIKRESWGSSPTQVVSNFIKSWVNTVFDSRYSTTLPLPSTPTCLTYSLYTSLLSYPSRPMHSETCLRHSEVK